MNVTHLCRQVPTLFNLNQDNHNIFLEKSQHDNKDTVKVNVLHEHQKEKHNRNKSRETRVFVSLPPLSKPDVPSPTFDLRIRRVNAGLYWKGKWTCGNTDAQRGKQTAKAAQRKDEMGFLMEIFHWNWSLTRDTSVKAGASLNKPTQKHMHTKSPKIYTIWLVIRVLSAFRVRIRYT